MGKTKKEGKMLVHNYPTQRRYTVLAINAEEERGKTIKQCKILLKEQLPPELEGRLKDLLIKVEA